MARAKEHHEAVRQAEALRGRGYAPVPERFDDPGGAQVRRLSGVVDLLREVGLDSLVERHWTAITAKGVEDRIWVPEWASVIWNAWAMHTPPQVSERIAARAVARDPEKQRALLAIHALGGNEGVRSFVDGLEEAIILGREAP